MRVRMSHGYIGIWKSGRHEKSPKDGTITDIHVHKGDTLQEGDPVVTIA